MTMRDTFRMLIVVGEAALMVAVGCCTLIPILVRSPSLSNPPTSLQTIATILAVAVPTGLATWWVFRKLQPYFSRREARAVAIAFAVFTPVALAIALLLYAIPGSIAAPLLSKSRFGFLAALLVGIALMTALLSFSACALALWIMRRTERAESHDLPKPDSHEF